MAASRNVTTKVSKFTGVIICLLQGAFNNKQPTTTLGMAGAQQMLMTNASQRSQQPFSFKASIDNLEDEIIALAQEVAFCKKEV